MSVNRVHLIGNVGGDPTFKSLDGGIKVSNFNLAVTKKGYTTQSGQVVADKTEWMSVACWRGLAETVNKYVKKGSKIYVSGEIQTREYQNAEGVKVRTFDIVADQVEFLSLKQTEDGTAESPRPQTIPTPPPAAREPDGDVQGNTAPDDLPF